MSSATLPASARAPAPFSVAQMRKPLKDLFEHRPAIYWTDFLITLAVGYAAAVTYLQAPLFSPLMFAAYALAGIALYRAGSYMHEIVHFRGRQMRGFRIAYDVLAGIPLLTPSHFYVSHLDHHSSNYYGTPQDAEYLPLAGGPLRHTLYFLSQVFFMPILVFIRCLVITPISFLHPKLRQWTLERVSSFAVNLKYRREIPKNAPRLHWALVEWGCCLRAAALVTLPFFGLTPFVRIPQLYAIAALILALNYLRTLAAHRFLSDGSAVSYEDQLGDSTNIEGNPILTEIWAPLGLRYHALHHVFPTLPYHNLGKAHRRLMRELPPDSPYRETVFPSYFSAIRSFMRSVRAARCDDYAQAKSWYQRRREYYRNWRGRSTGHVAAVVRKPADSEQQPRMRKEELAKAR